MCVVQVSCGLCSDPSAEDEPEKVTRYWKEEFEALYAEAMAFEGGNSTTITQLSSIHFPLLPPAGCGVMRFSGDVCMCCLQRLLLIELYIH